MSMLRRLSALVVVGALAMGLAACDDDDIMTPGEEVTPGENDDFSITIGDNFFEPEALRLEPGDTLTFEHEGENTHTVTVNGVNQSGDLESGDSFAFEFDRVGDHSVRCDYHVEMVLDIEVVDMQ